ncbi:hypothetical protein VTK73DRAFT_5215 [Phialemonium thermophilum]|uniref:Uncharacterized protein n=1 Tax=Phialemonium thermophilum TaxID=223376 RepID=A0ABR3V3W8_9PEZI
MIGDWGGSIHSGQASNNKSKEHIEGKDLGLFCFPFIFSPSPLSFFYAFGDGWSVVNGYMSVHTAHILDSFSFSFFFPFFSCVFLFYFILFYFGDRRTNRSSWLVYQIRVVFSAGEEEYVAFGGVSPGSVRPDSYAVSTKSVQPGGLITHRMGTSTSSVHRGCSGRAPCSPSLLVPPGHVFRANHTAGKGTNHPLRQLGTASRLRITRAGPAASSRSCFPISSDPNCTAITTGPHPTSSSLPICSFFFCFVSLISSLSPSCPPIATRGNSSVLFFFFKKKKNGGRHAVPGPPRRQDRGRRPGRRADGRRQTLLSLLEEEVPQDAHRLRPQDARGRGALPARAEGSGDGPTPGRRERVRIGSFVSCHFLFSFLLFPPSSGWAGRAPLRWANDEIRVSPAACSTCSSTSTTPPRSRPTSASTSASTRPPTTRASP